MNDRAANVRPVWCTAEKQSANLFELTYSMQNQSDNLLWVLLRASMLLFQEDWRPT
jgi:hypothetical protein